MTTAPTTAPAQGTEEIQDAGHVDDPWTHMIEHEQEREILPKADLDDGTLVYR
jgi:hypothetical protein